METESLLHVALVELLEVFQCFDSALLPSLRDRKSNEMSFLVRFQNIASNSITYRICGYLPDGLLEEASLTTITVLNVLISILTKSIQTWRLILLNVASDCVQCHVTFDCDCTVNVWAHWIRPNFNCENFLNLKIRTAAHNILRTTMECMTKESILV